MPGQVWVIEDPEKKTARREAQSAQSPRAVRTPKSPAAAASLSLLFWGWGQFYTQQPKWGFILFLLMANFFAAFGLLLFYWDFILPYLGDMKISRSGTLFAAGIFYLTGLLTWIFNILHAYQKAVETQTEPFEGILYPPLVILGSILVPGWGQLLNGQPKKASLFLIFAAAGFTVVTVFLLALRVWPTLQTVDDRIFVEWMIVAAVILSPLVLLMWLIGIYDAAKVSLDPVKKEPLRNRFEYAINRIRIKGLARGLLPQLKVLSMLVLILTLTLVMGHFYFPMKNYAPLLQTIQNEAADRRMILIPYLIDHFRQSVLPESHPEQ